MKISGKAVLFFVTSQIACNGWWFFFTQDVPKPILIIPIVASGGILVFLINWINKNW